ncbi:MAG: CBS domain-containing protein [Halobacteriales archaeon]|nr:CBS domain-containing protein [Halobacteriales archaeon]
MSTTHTTVGDIASSPVRTTPPEESVTEIAKTLFEEGIGSVVVADDGEPIGIITESDVVALVANGADCTSVSAASAMSDSLITIEPDVRLEDAAHRMKEHEIKKLPVVGEEGLIGMVTTTDLATHFPQYHPRGEQWTP